MKIIGHVENDSTPCIIIEQKRHRTHLIIDTGFDGELCLNEITLKKWGFVFKGTQEVELADGSLVPNRIYVGEICWFGKKIRVLANETQSEDCLLGTSLLWGVVLNMDIAEGKVVLENKTLRKK